MGGQESAVTSLLKLAGEHKQELLLARSNDGLTALHWAATLEGERVLPQFEHHGLPFSNLPFAGNLIAQKGVAVSQVIGCKLM